MLTFLQLLRPYCSQRDCRQGRAFQCLHHDEPFIRGGLFRALASRQRRNHDRVCGALRLQLGRRHGARIGGGGEHLPHGGDWIQDGHHTGYCRPGEPDGAPRGRGHCLGRRRQVLLGLRLRRAELARGGYVPDLCQGQVGWMEVDGQSVRRITLHARWLTQWRESESISAKLYGEFLES